MGAEYYALAMRINETPRITILHSYSTFVSLCIANPMLQLVDLTTRFFIENFFLQPAILHSESVNTGKRKFRRDKLGASSKADLCKVIILQDKYIYKILQSHLSMILITL